MNLVADPILWEKSLSHAIRKNVLSIDVKRLCAFCLFLKLAVRKEEFYFA